jgi:hypothetical protein
VLRHHSAGHVDDRLKVVEDLLRFVAMKVAN